MTIYRIADWNANFENNRTRELKALQWVPFPNRHDGDGYTELMDHKDGAAHFGAWVAIVQVASKCDPRGTLMRDSARPHDTASLSRMTRIPKKVLDAAIKRLIEIGWIVVSRVADDTCEMSQDGAILESQGGAALTEGNGMEGKGNEEKRNEQNGNEEKGTGPPLPAALDTPEFQKTWSQFEKHRVEIKKKLTPTARQQQIERMEKLGHDRAIAAIKHSIANGWTGIFEQDGGRNGKSAKPGRNREGEYPEDISPESVPSL